MKNKWLYFVILYFSALCVALSQLKIVMVMGDIAVATGLQNLSDIAWLMSVFTVAGIILSIPGGALLAKLGPKKLLLTLMAFLLVGNLIGAFATNSFEILLVSRVLEGVSFAMIIMTGIVMITEWFAGGNVGLAIGIYTTFPALGSVIAMNVSAPIAAAFGLNSLWLIVAGLTVLAAILSAAFIKLPTPVAGSADAATPSAEKPSLAKALANAPAWVLALCHGCVAFVLFTFITIYPQVFSGLYQLDQGTAGFYASLNGLFGIPFCIIAGFIVDKVRNVSLIVVVSFVLLGAVCFLTTQLGPATYILHTLLAAIFTGLILPANLAIAPRIAKSPALIGYTVALVNLVYYIGVFAGAPLVLGAIETSGWQSGVNILAIACAIGAVAMVLFMILRRKKTV